jgi:hypothetical protein
VSRNCYRVINMRSIFICSSQRVKWQSNSLVYDVIIATEGMVKCKRQTNILLRYLKSYFLFWIVKGVIVSTVLCRWSSEQVQVLFHVSVTDRHDELYQSRGTISVPWPNLLPFVTVLISIHEKWRYLVMKCHNITTAHPTICQGYLTADLLYTPAFKRNKCF